MQVISVAAAFHAVLPWNSVDALLPEEQSPIPMRGEARGAVCATFYYMEATAAEINTCLNCQFAVCNNCIGKQKKSRGRTKRRASNAAV